MSEDWISEQQSGGIGGEIVSAITSGGFAAAPGMDVGSLISQLVGGGVGGAAVLVVTGPVKQKRFGQKPGN